MATFVEHREESEIPLVHLGHLSLSVANASELEVVNHIASVEREIVAVAESIKLASVKIEEIWALHAKTASDLLLLEETSAKHKILTLLFQSQMDDKAMLLQKEAKLMDEKAMLMQKEAKLMDDKAKRSQTQRSTRSSLLLAQPESTLVTTPPGQSKASSFAGNMFADGFGFLPSSFHFDPTFRLRVWSRLVPDSEDLASEAVKSLLVLGELGNLLHQGEDSTDGVRPMLDSFLQLPQLQSSGSQLNAGGGIVSAASKPDFLWNLHGSPLGVLEVKGGSSSVLSALRQAAVTATNIAVSLLEQGHRAEDIVVPVAGSTGRAMQFGAVFVLEPSFPTFLPTSHILDLACDSSNALANAYLIKASKWVKEFGLKLGSPKIKVKMDLDCSKYHIKRLDENTLKRGLGLFTSSSEPGVSEVGPGLQHMGRVLNKLFAHPAARAVTVFPLSVRSPSEDNPAMGTRCYWLVYEDLAAEGFRIGTPDRIQDSILYGRFLQALRQGISDIHEAGVIHCDLYPSNIMWKADAEGESVEIRLIDWDNAHCLDEQDFGEKCKAALMEHKPTRSAKFGVDHDWKYFDVLSSAINSGEEQWWAGLASSNKNDVDNAFYALFPIW